MFYKMYFNKHTQPISCLDWHSKKNSIISSSYDNNVIIWNYNGSIWLAKMVIMNK